MHFFFDLSLQKLQPLVLLEGEVYAKADQKGAPAALVSALGAVHPLGRLCSKRFIEEQHLRLNRTEAARLLQEELLRRHAAGLEALGYFIDHLVPAFQQRDWSEAPPIDLSSEVVQAVEGLPLPDVPCPSLWLCGRAWVLQPKPGPPGALHVRWGETTLGLSGEYHLAGALHAAWENKARAFIQQTAARLGERHASVQESSQLRWAREEVARNGACQVGDLLFLAGAPPRLGYLLPPHYNRALGRDSRGDLAMTVPLLLPPQVLGITVYSRAAGGRWGPCPLPNGLCLGTQPPEDRPTHPGLALAAYLRWAAWRIAVNGIFHSRDGASPEDNNEPTYY